jgi:DNA-binding NarL/FixJ family response regulator
MIKETIKIAIAEPSHIIRYGVAAALKHITGLRFVALEFDSLDSLHAYMSTSKVDVLIINPSFWGSIDFPKFKITSTNRKIKFVALITSAVDSSIIEAYDTSIGMYDTSDQIGQKLEKLFNSNTKEDENINTLSVREKEVLVCVVKGLTNREIAEILFLSTHTVITHRKNIARKLEIHSPAGLTIYAIVNKLVNIEDISYKL